MVTPFFLTARWRVPRILRKSSSGRPGDAPGQRVIPSTSETIHTFVHYATGGATAPLNAEIRIIRITFLSAYAPGQAKSVRTALAPHKSHAPMTPDCVVNVKVHVIAQSRASVHVGLPTKAGAATIRSRGAREREREKARDRE